MFIDYYSLLELQEKATQEDVKIAFREQALKWHPDQNVGTDTNKRMQEINEAYLILKDPEARARYNIEYTLFQRTQQKEQFQQQQKTPREKAKPSQQQKSNKGYSSYEYPNYTIQDDILYKWINNARKQAVDLAKQTIEDFKGMASAGLKAAAEGAGYQLIAQIAIGIMFILFFALTKTCGN